MSSRARALKPHHSSKPSLAKAAARKIPEPAPSEIRISEPSLEATRSQEIAKLTRTATKFIRAMVLEYKPDMKERAEILETFKKAVFTVKPEDEKVFMVASVTIANDDDDIIPHHE